MNVRIGHEHEHKTGVEMETTTDVMVSQLRTDYVIAMLRDDAYPICDVCGRDACDDVDGLTLCATCVRRMRKRDAN